MAIHVKQPGATRSIGSWQRSMGFRYWEGPCMCGSGRDGHEVYDDNGIYFGISCTACNRKPSPGPYDEPIEEE